MYLLFYRIRILVQVVINRRLLIGRDGRLDQSENLRFIATCTRIRAQDTLFQIQGDRIALMAVPFLQYLGSVYVQTEHVLWPSIWQNEYHSGHLAIIMSGIVSLPLFFILPPPPVNLIPGASPCWQGVSRIPYRIKPEELCILSYGKGRRLWPSPQLRMESSEGFNWLKTQPNIMRIPHNQQLSVTPDWL